MAKLGLSIARASTMKPSRLATKPSVCIPNLSWPGTTKTGLSRRSVALQKPKLPSLLTGNLQPCQCGIDPNNAIAWNAEAWAFNSQAKYDEAIKACDEAIRLDPKLNLAWINKGWALEALGRTNEANAALWSEANTSFARAKKLRYKGQLQLFLKA